MVARISNGSIFTGLTGGLGLSGAAAVAAASELPLSPHGEVPPHPDQLSDTSGVGDQGTRLGLGQNLRMLTIFLMLYRKQFLHA